jgi:hypothetical protein
MTGGGVVQASQVLGPILFVAALVVFRGLWIFLDRRRQARQDRRDGRRPR